MRKQPEKINLVKATLIFTVRLGLGVKSILSIRGNLTKKKLKKPEVKAVKRKSVKDQKGKESLKVDNIMVFEDIDDKNFGKIPKKYRTVKIRK